MFQKDNSIENKIIQVTSDNFDKYRNDIKKLLWENMMRHYNAGKVNEEYFETKTSEIIDYLNEKKAVIFVYVLDNSVKGCIWAYPKLFLDERRLFVQLLQVYPENRNYGIGGSLLQTIEKYAVEHGYNAVDMITSANNEGALRFYQREGYEFERIQLCKVFNEDK